MDDWIKTAGTTITNTVLKKRETCFGCAIRCKGVVDIPGKADPEYGGPEYETCATFGSYCGNTDLGDICHANQLCNMFGLDTITAARLSRGRWNVLKKEFSRKKIPMDWN